MGRHMLGSHVSLCEVCESMRQQMDNRGQCNTDSVKQEANLSALGQLADGKPDVLAASALACMQHAQPCCKACYWNEGNLSPAAALSRGLCGQRKLGAEAESQGRASCPQTWSQVPTLKDKVSWESRKKLQ